MDGFEGKTEKARYDYPFAEPPVPGTVLEVAPGVHWVRMPLPFSLKWINLWLLEDGDGWTVVDTGIPNSETKAHWRTIFDTVLGGKPVKRVIVTHMHPDHIGLAGWMTRKWQCDLWISRLEYVSCRMLVADTGREAPEAGVKFYRAGSTAPVVVADGSATTAPAMAPVAALGSIVWPQPAAARAAAARASVAMVRFMVKSFQWRALNAAHRRRFRHGRRKSILRLHAL